MRYADAVSDPEHLESATDAELLAAWSDGDQPSGRALVRRFTPSLHRFFISKAPEAVEDLIQATFLAMVENRDRFRGSASFRTFVLAIGRRTLLKHYRKQMRGDRAMALERMTADAVSGSPSFIAATRQEVRLLVSALRRIPIDHQIALELFYWEELSVSEVAEVLGVAPGTVKSRLARARTQLREVIEHLSADPEVKRRTLEDPEHWARELRGVRFPSGSGGSR